MIGVEDGQPLSQGLYHLPCDFVPLQESLQRIAYRKTAHFESIVDDLTMVLKGVVLIILSKRHHLKIDARAESTIQGELLLTVEAALVQGREIQKSQVDGLLQFVGIAIGQKHQRDMGLAHLYSRGRFRIDSRILQRLAPGSDIHHSLLALSDCIGKGIPLAPAKLPSPTLHLPISYDGFKRKSSPRTPALKDLANRR